MVLVASRGLMTGSVAGDSVSANELLGAPNSALAATWSATSGDKPAVARSMTPAPCEYPPSTILVLGQFAAVDWMCALASLAPAGVLVSKSLLAGSRRRTRRRSAHRVEGEA